MSKTLDKKNPRIIAFWKYVFQRVKDQSIRIEDFAQKLGQGVSTLHKWKADAHPPDLELVEKISTILEEDVLKNGYFKEVSTAGGNRLTEVLERLVASKEEEIATLKDEKSEWRNDKKFLHNHISWLENRFGSCPGDQAKQ